MAEIEHLDVGSGDRTETARKLVELYQQLDQGGLIAQQVLLHGAADALWHLLTIGPNQANARNMLEDVMFQLGVIRGYAKSKGLTLPEVRLAAGVVH